MTVPSSDFSKLCKELYSISETVSVNCNKGFVQFSVEGEVGSGSVRLNNNEGVSGKDSKMKGADGQTFLEVSEAVEQQFALRYLNMFNKAATMSPFTRLCLH